MIGSSVSDSQSSYDFEHHLATSKVSDHHPEGHLQESFSYVDPPISNLKATFRQLDPQNKGFIHKQLLRSTLMMTSQQYDRHIINQQIDSCEDEIKYSRFIDIFRCANVGEKVNMWLFGLYDREKKGFIDAQDLRRASAITNVELSEEQIQQMLSTQRNRGTGLVDYQDFKYFMQEEIQYL